ncbi:WEB family protein At2g17940-like [Phalaenopsis equestris]|uniref:WEB family protein At2g17940-like n=1 Tax=Phalaenopsis equestris TaxID=78828 RepID=UPI0009E57B8E|nr:WEB family protein At2g17940-like [Phalaenopsis equestris]
MESVKGGHGRAPMVRAGVDTSSPFQSVKEAVMLFGEKVLVGDTENKLKEVRATTDKHKQTTSSLHSLEIELEQTTQNLLKAREERKAAVNCLNSVIQELEKTKTELKRLKVRDRENSTMDSEVEHIKFIENAMPILNEDAEFESKRFMKFNNLPSLGRFFSSENLLDTKVSMDREVLELIKKKKKKRAFLPVIASIFSKKREYRHEASITRKISTGVRISSEI